MKGKFVFKQDVEWDELDWGKLGWISRPANTGSANLTVLDVVFKAGGGHAFHKHPNQEEVITVISGEIEQWLEDEMQILRPGDSIYIDADVVHASFNMSEEPAKLIVVLGPSDGANGYEVDEVADQAPWKDLR